MNKLLFSAYALFIFTGCKQQTGNEEASIVPRTRVEVTNISYGSIQDELELFATTTYLKRNVVNAPIAGYITKVNILLGDYVKKGTVLYVLESKERRALGSKAGGLDTSFKDFGVIKVVAQASGRVTTLDKQQAGDYVLEGVQLCTIAENNDLAFLINVPYEFVKYVTPGKGCTIILPDNSRHSAVISTSLANMNIASQTQTYMAKVKVPISLPESLIVKVLVNKGDNVKKQLLPRSCVLSDEMLQHFWVMMLIDDSTAAKVSVELGDQNNTQVEILKPLFNATDEIIKTGSYGLNDTALVRVVNENVHE